MIKLTELLGALDQCAEAQRQLALCRKHATGDVEYYSHSYRQDLQRAEEALEQSLNGYIDQRVEEKLGRFTAPAATNDPRPALSASPPL